MTEQDWIGALICLILLATIVGLLWVKKSVNDALEEENPESPNDEIRRTSGFKRKSL
ncbi:MAG: hypothetical protein WC810_23940 [Janthinobacterium sp.]|jgi:hypothetical protein